jgi:hypothetical protein
VPVIPLDRDIVLHARRLVAAQQCLYGRLDWEPARDRSGAAMAGDAFMQGTHVYLRGPCALDCGGFAGGALARADNPSLDAKGGFKRLQIWCAGSSQAVAEGKKRSPG